MYVLSYPSLDQTDSKVSELSSLLNPIIKAAIQLARTSENLLFSTIIHTIHLLVCLLLSWGIWERKGCTLCSPRAWILWSSDSFTGIPWVQGAPSVPWCFLRVPVMSIVLSTLKTQCRSCRRWMLPGCCEWWLTDVYSCREADPHSPSLCTLVADDRTEPLMS